MEIGKKIYNDLVDLEKKFWNREDYSEDDITTFSNAMDFIAEHLKEFEEYFKEKEDDTSKF